MERLELIKHRKVVNPLLLNASFIENLGLLNGKMGISIYFFHLFRNTKKTDYRNYANELIEELYEEISNETPPGFQNGLAGIGAALEYLVRNHFIEANTDEVLEDLDDALFHNLINNTPEKIDLMNGLTGLGIYFLKRVQNRNSKNESIQTLANKQTLIHLIDEFDRRLDDSQILDILKENTFFDLSWNLTALLWLFLELHNLGIFIFKTEKIIIRLLDYMGKEEKWPQLESNGILLILLFKKLKKCKNLDLTNINELLYRFDVLKVANRETIEKELFPNNFSIRNGTSGIAWMYHQLFADTRTEAYLKERDFWHKRSLTLLEANTEHTDVKIDSKSNHYGLFEGIAGIGLMETFV